MPVISVIGAVTGASALASVGAAGLGVWGTVGAIGGIVSGIGALTGNDDMMRLGAVAGLAGGAGAFAQSQGWLSSGSAATTAAQNASGGNINAMTKTQAPGVQPVSSPVDQAPSAVVGDTAGLETGGIGQNITSTNQLAGNGLFDTVGFVTDAGIAGSPFTAGPGAASAPLPMEPGGFAKSLGETTLGAGARNMRFDAGAGSSEMSIFDRIKGFGKFVEDNKQLSSIAANFIGGMFDDTKKAKAEADRAYADAVQRKMANGSAVPDMRAKLKQSGPIWKTSSPTYNAPRPSGLFYAR